jgi:hypothetical protein
MRAQAQTAGARRRLHHLDVALRPGSIDDDRRGEESSELHEEICEVFYVR